MGISTDRNFEKIEKLCTDVFKLYPAKIMVCLDNSTKETVYDYAEVQLLHDDFEIVVSHDEYRKKYVISARITENLPNIDNDTIWQIMRELQEPNQIGVLSAKKILEWVNYYEAIYSRAYRINEENAKEKEAFLLSIKDMPVKWNEDKDRGTIVKNGIEFTFTIGRKYVTKKMELHYDVPTTIKSFKLLSDNKYKK